MYKDYSYFVSSSITLPVKVLVHSLHLVPADPQSPIPKVLQQIPPGDSHRDAPHSELLVTVQIITEGFRMYPMPITTRNPPRCNGSIVTWDEWVTLPVTYRDLSIDSYLVFTVWGPSNVAAATATISIFDSAMVLREGLQKLRMAPQSETPRFECTPEGPDDKQEQEWYRLEKLVEKYERGEMPSLNWLDDMTFKQMRQTRDAASRSAGSGNECLFTDHIRNLTSVKFYASLPYFGAAVLYDGDGYLNARAPSAIDGSLTSIETQINSVRAALGDTSEMEGPGTTSGDVTGTLRIRSEALPSYRHTAYSSVQGRDGGRGTLKTEVTTTEQALLWVFDTEMGADNPVDHKYRKLVRGARRLHIDPDLKPNSEERAVIQQVVNSPADELTEGEKDLLWKFRFSLTTNPRALTKFLLCVDWQDEGEVQQVGQLLQLWAERAPIEIADALKLLGRQKEYSMDIVREFAVKTLSKATNEELLDYLLQLVQALRYEPGSARGTENMLNTALNATGDEVVRGRGGGGGMGFLATFLVSRACQSLELANYLYWYLKVAMEDPNDGPMFANIFQFFTSRLLEQPESSAIYQAIVAQETFVMTIAEQQRAARDSRGNNSQKEQKLRELLKGVNLPKGVAAVRMPLDPSKQAIGLNPPSAFMFKSAMHPAVIEFRTLAIEEKASSDKDFFGGDESAFGGGAPVGEKDRDRRSQRRAITQLFDKPKEGTPYKVVFKSGDDMRQDQLVIQMIILIDRLLKKINLDLKLTPYRVLATSPRDGLMEFVSGSKTLKSVIVRGGNNPILDFLREANPDPQAELGVRPEVLDAYVKSCAGYCVITYLLGVGDRHQENLMLLTDGRLFHLDFGFLFGRDPKPMAPAFRITKEMVDGFGGEKRQKEFVLHCCQAYNRLREHARLILNLLSLMVDAGIPDLRDEPETKLAKVQEKFRLDLNDQQAEEYFIQLIQQCTTAVWPRIHDILHDVASRFKA